MKRIFITFSLVIGLIFPQQYNQGSLKEFIVKQDSIKSVSPKTITTNALKAEDYRERLMNPMLTMENSSLGEAAAKAGYGQSRFDRFPFEPGMTREDVEAKRKIEREAWLNKVFWITFLIVLSSIGLILGGVAISHHYQKTNNNGDDWVSSDTAH